MIRSMLILAFVIVSSAYCIAEDMKPATAPVGGKKELTPSSIQASHMEKLEALGLLGNKVLGAQRQAAWKEYYAWEKQQNHVGKSMKFAVIVVDAKKNDVTEKDVPLLREEIAELEKAMKAGDLDESAKQIKQEEIAKKKTQIAGAGLPVKITAVTKDAPKVEIVAYVRQAAEGEMPTAKSEIMLAGTLESFRFDSKSPSAVITRGTVTAAPATAPAAGAATQSTR